MVNAFTYIKIITLKTMIYKLIFSIIINNRISISVITFILNQKI